MEDEEKIESGLLLRSDSEYLPLFRHYIHKGKETGIYHRFHKTYYRRFEEPIEIGFPESEPLGLNNMGSAFYFLGGLTIISLLTLIAENLVYMFKAAKTRKNEVNFLFHYFITIGE